MAKVKKRQKSISLNDEAVSVMREICMEGLGFNCIFVDDNMALLIGLAQRAVLAGLENDCTPDMRRRFKEASEKYRAGHEKALGRPIPTF